MTQAESTTSTEAPALPDFYTDANAVLGDSSASWRYGRPPDYSKTRKFFAETKRMNHEAGSLPQLVENLVKNWEIEASFKIKLEDWRTVNHSRYTFSINGGPPQTAHHMLKVGTYNAIIAPNEFYSPETSDFASSHKTFKRMMPTFAWEVLEVYSGPPKVAFRWRHWGEMKNNYVGYNDRGEKVTAKAHGGTIDIQGVTVADLDEEMKVTQLDTWFDPMDMFRQIASEGIVDKQPVDAKITNGSLEQGSSESISKETVSSTSIPQQHAYISEKHTAVVTDGVHTRHVLKGNSEFMDAQEHWAPTVEPAVEIALVAAEAENKAEDTPVMTSSKDQLEKTESGVVVKEKVEPKSVNAEITSEVSDAAVKPEEVDHNIDEAKIEDAKLNQDRTVAQPNSEEAKADIKPDRDEAVVAGEKGLETRITHGEMSRFTPAGCPFMNGP